MLTDIYKLLKRIPDAEPESKAKVIGISPGSKSTKLKRIIPKILTYDRPKDRTEWKKPEYDVTPLQIAQASEAILLRTIKKKTDRLLVAGYDFGSTNAEALAYIKRRVAEIEMVSSLPFPLLLSQTAEELIRQKNCIWIKSRSSDSSSGSVREDIDGHVLEPVAAYTPIAFSTIEFKTNMWGGIKKYRQILPEGLEKEYNVSDVIFFTADKKPGFLMGTPDLIPALDDIALLRRIEEHVEDLIETSLFPVYHYKIGTDDMPERVGPDGKFESEILERKIRYMDPGGVLVSDHRLEISAIGSANKALNIDTYIAYFLDRAILASGGNKIDLGMGGDSNRSTANTLTKSSILDVEAVQAILKIYIEFFVINELLLEGGYNPYDEADKVEIVFGVIDKEERLAFENQQIQMVTTNLLTMTEARKKIGRAPYTEEDIADTYYKLFEEPGILAKGMVPGSAAGEALAGMGQSNVTPEAINKEKAQAAKLAAAKTKATGRPPTSKGKTAAKTAGAKARPSNQSGTRSSPKLNKDISLQIGSETITITIDSDSVINNLDPLVAETEVMYNTFNKRIKRQTILNNLLPRYINVN